MAYATWGRSLAPQPPPGSVGDDAIPPAAQPPGTTPGILTMYPGCTPRPRNKRAYDAACAAANGQHVIELNASQIESGMRAWCCGSFLAVAAASHMRVSQIDDENLRFLSEASRAHPFVLLQLDSDGQSTGWIIGELDTPVYVLA